MKKFLLGPIWAGIIVCLALAGCQNLLDPPERAAVPQGKGRVVVTIGGAAARTLAPATIPFATYTLTFVGPETVKPVEVTGSGGSAEQDLAPGEWTITATAYNDSNTAVAAGSAEVTVASGDSAAVNILLTPKTGGANGTFSYLIKVYTSLKVGDLIISTPDGDVVAQKTLDKGLDWSGDAGGGENNRGNVSLPPGEYVLRAWLETESTPKYCGRTEVIHIYSGLTTRLEGWSFDTDDFFEAVTELDLTDWVTPPVAWATPAASFSGSSQYYADNYGSGSTAAFYNTNDTDDPSDDTPIYYNGIFLANTVYKAVVRLVATGGYGFTGVAANSFTHSGADSVTNDVDAGQTYSPGIRYPYGWVTIVFPRTGNAVVTGVTVTPSSTTVAQGAQQTFSATVTGTLDGNVVTPPQAVTWSVSGNQSSGTKISQNGVLTVATTENSTSLTVTATPAADPSCTLGTATVTVNIVDAATEIDTAEKLAKIGTDTDYPLGGKYILTADLTLSDWVPIGDNSTPFFGTFDGNDKQITLNSFASSALSGKAYLGVFGYIKGTDADSKAVVKNLKIVSGVSSATITGSGTKYIGLLAGYANNAEISGVTLSGSLGLTSSLALYAGGLVGYATDSVNIANCHNTGNITATITGQTVYCGGIAGRSSGAIENCSSTGDIAASTSGTVKHAYVGGIAGTIVGTYDLGSRIKACQAAGNIAGTTTATNGNAYVGGIVGQNSTNSLISQSYFNGTVTENGQGNNTSGGGIAGSNSQASRIEDCWSNGTVNGINSAGGIAGRNDLTSAKPAFIVRCYSTAAVARTGSADGNTGAGGIAGINRGDANGKSEIEKCVALNSKISSGGGENIHRVAGGAPFAGLTNNYAWTGITITPNAGTYDKGTDKVDGADKTASELDGDFYKGLDWDFDDVWAMDTNGYPKLQWQTTEIVRSLLTP